MPNGGASHLHDPVRKPCMNPFGEVRRQRRDDDLVIAFGVPRLVDRDDRIRVADTPIDVKSVRAQMLEGFSEPRVRGRSPARGRNDQSECRLVARGSLVQRSDELLSLDPPSSALGSVRA
jgi:hypothetical protein